MAWIILMALCLAMAAPIYWALRHFQKPPEHRDVALIASGIIFSVFFLAGAWDLTMGPVR